jgi:hypothetical protein
LARRPAARSANTQTKSRWVRLCAIAWGAVGASRSSAPIASAAQRPACSACSISDRSANGFRRKCVRARLVTAAVDRRLNHQFSSRIGLASAALCRPVSARLFALRTAVGAVDDRAGTRGPLIPPGRRRRPAERRVCVGLKAAVRQFVRGVCGGLSASLSTQAAPAVCMICRRAAMWRSKASRPVGVRRARTRRRCPFTRRSCST